MDGEGQGGTESVQRELTQCRDGAGEESGVCVEVANYFGWREGCTGE